MGARTDTRRKMLDAGIALLRERGVGAVTVEAVLSRSGAPRGSVYHHFPNGRAEIVAESLKLSQDAISSIIDQATAHGARAALKGFVKFWARVVEVSDFNASCPVVSVAVGAPDDPDLQRSVREIIHRWQETITQTLINEGVEPARASRLTTMTLSAVEGAIVLCRVNGSLDPLRKVQAELDALLTSAIPISAGKPFPEPEVRPSALI